MAGAENVVRHVEDHREKFFLIVMKETEVPNLVADAEPQLDKERGRRCEGSEWSASHGRPGTVAVTLCGATACGSTPAQGPACQRAQG